jgi:autotransporter-associated beta strand protein
MFRHMKTLKLSLCLLATLLPRFVFAALNGPYTPDANTLVLLHLNEAAGGSVTTNVGSLGGNFYSVNYTTDPATLPLVTTMLGATGYSTNLPTSISFGNCEYNTTTGYEFGYDYNRDGIFEGDTGGGTSLDFMTMSTLNIGNGGQTPFTLEALIQPTTTAGNQEIICTDSDAGSRGFQFRISAATLAFQFITGAQAIAGTIPTTGPNAFVAGTWYHVALVYNGTTATLYWTKLDPSIGAASVLISGSLAMGTSDGAVKGPLVIGNRGRPDGTETFLGGIDEVRISNVARAANQMQFFSPTVTITQNPVSQNVDYNQPVTFSVGASSLTTLGYQWLFNSNAIAGATNTSYIIPHVSAANSGYYDVVVTNISGFANTSSVAALVVGAANFLTHRYSFTNDDTDSIGGANGTNFGDAYVTNGELVLDGTTGTYMQLPPNLFNGASATALTVEFWATYGVNANNAYVFSLGYTNFILGSGIVGVDYVCYSPHNASGQGLIISPSESAFQQQVTAPGTLDGLTCHVACVIDPPNQNLAIYTNGVLEAINTNMTVSIANLNDALSYIGQSLFAADPYLNANIDELRLYNGALSGLSIAQSQVQGPNTILADGPAKFVLQPVNTSTPLGQTATFSAAAVGYLPITYQWFKNSVLIPGATNASFAYTPTLADNNASIVCYATNIIGVTTYVTNSSTATLAVFLPPTLSWLGAADGGADNSWNTSSLDWTNDLSGGGIIAFAQTNGVLFDDRSGGGSVDLEQTIIPYNITVNTADGYMFTSSGGLGALTGQCALTKTGSGILNIDVTNNLSGSVTISSGELQIGNGDGFGSLGSSVVTNNATLSINRSDTALNLGNTIHGSGTLSFDSSGSVTVSGGSDYSGSTLINQGIVFLVSSTGLGSTSTGTTVASGAQLYITANVNVAEGLSLIGAGDGNGALRKGGAGLTVESAAISLAGDSTIGVDSGATLTLSNAISGTAALTATGGGILTLNSNNTFNGGFTLNGPEVDLNSSHALSTGTVTVGGAGRFVIGDGLNITNFFQASEVSPATGFGLLMVNDNTNGTVTTVSGPLEFDASPASGGDFVGPITSGYLNVTGPVTNTATGVVGSRNGFVRFSGGGNYSTFNINQGTVSLGANNGLSTNATVMVAVSAAASFDLNGFNQALTGLYDGAANAELVTNSAGSPGTLTLNISSGGTYSGVIAGNVALVENGSANWYLAGTNAYTGNTSVNGGTLELAQPSLAASSTVTVAGGAVLQLDFTGTNTVTGLVLNGVNQTLGVYNSTTSSPYIAGSGSLQVAVFVATNPTNLTATVSGGNLVLSWPADHLGWRLQAQTNSLSTGLGTNWVNVPNTATVTAVTNALNRANGSVFYRMIYP